jgi:hypothetical protein
MAIDFATYQQHAEDFVADDVEGFRHLLREGMESLGLGMSDLCDRFDVGMTTVERWLAGESAPQPAFRTLIIDHLTGHAQRHAA